MAMSKREKYIAITVAAVIGIGVADWFITSQMETGEALDQQIVVEKKKLDEELRLIRAMPGNQQQLDKLTSTSLTRDASDASFQVLGRLYECALQVGMNPAQTQYRPGAEAAVRLTKGVPPKDAPQFMRQPCRVTVLGNMSQISRFAYLVNHSEIPLRVTDMVINPVKENTDDFKVEFTISTIFLTQGTEPGRGAQAGAGAATRAASGPAASNATGQNQNQIQQNNGGRSGAQALQQGGRGSRGSSTTTTAPTEAR